MTKEDQEPVERLEEFFPHSAANQSAQRKKDLADIRQELAILLGKLPNPAPKKGSKGYETYCQIQSQIQDLKTKISKTHDDLMEILKSEEKLSREIGKNKS
ncbi:MAG: hypothetical protein K1X28_09005 [Parachlamydiales bacterium]|nr:hypothetical protein [Parachlamydiales bacterium]